MGLRKVEDLNGGDDVSFNDVPIHVLHVFFSDVLVYSSQGVRVVRDQAFNQGTFSTEPRNPKPLLYRL